MIEGHVLVTRDAGALAVPAAAAVIDRGGWVCIIDDASEDDTYGLLLADHKGRAKDGRPRAAILLSHQVPCGEAFCWEEAGERMRVAFEDVPGEELLLRKWKVKVPA